MSFASFLCVVVHFSGRVGTGPFFSTSFRINNQELFPGPGVGGLVTFLSIVSALFTFILGKLSIVDAVLQANISMFRMHSHLPKFARRVP